MCICVCVCVCVWFVGLYGISTLVVYLMLNLVHTYILNISDLKTHFVDNIIQRA